MERIEFVGPLLRLLLRLFLLSPMMYSNCLYVGTTQQITKAIASDAVLTLSILLRMATTHMALDVDVTSMLFASHSSSWRQDDDLEKHRHDWFMGSCRFFFPRKLRIGFASRGEHHHHHHAGMHVRKISGIIGSVVMQ